MDYSKRTSPRGYRYVFILVDNFSRKAFCYLQKTKTSAETMANFKLWLKHLTFKKDLRVICADLGREFLDIKKYCDKNKRLAFITSYTSESHASSVESVIKFIRRHIAKTLASRGQANNEWCEHVKNSTRLYNLKRHSFTNVAPEQVESAPSEYSPHIRKLHEQKYMRAIRSGIKYNRNDLRYGDYVRIKKSTVNFSSRATNQDVTDEVFKIIKVNSRLPLHTYDLADLSSEELKGSFYPHELVKTNIFSTHEPYKKIMSSVEKTKGYVYLIFKHKTNNSKQIVCLPKSFMKSINPSFVD